MVLDIELFRTDKGGESNKVRENQAKRFKDVTLVDRVVEADTRWRKRKYLARCRLSVSIREKCRPACRYISFDVYSICVQYRDNRK